MTRVGPITIERVRGTRIEFYGRTLTPVARVVSAIRHRGTIKETGIEGRGGGVAFVIPLEVVEEYNGQVRILPIKDATCSVLRQMAIVAALTPVVAIVLVLINRWMRRR